MNDLKTQAAELGIAVDGRWSDARLQEEIDKVLAAAPPEVIGQTPGPSPTPITKTIEPKGSEAKVKMLLKADYWPEEDQRRVAGETIEMPKSKARELHSQGKAEPSIDLLGEDD